MELKALIIEDNEEIFQVVKSVVEDLGYRADHQTNGKLGLQHALADEYSFVILDLMLPGLKGSEILKGIRKAKPELPVLMLTAKSETLDKVLLLELGADDYITKPFEAVELAARISAVLRRSSMPIRGVTKDTIAVGDLFIDFRKRIVLVDGEEANLTAREFDILAMLASNPGVPMSRETLVDRIYGCSTFGYEQTVSSHINRIRNKIEKDAAKPKYVLTSRGVGYLFVD